ncbi:MAG TPA: RDD family protein, partial [Xanthomonadales bacterium]|nr:RDD family protein [Xanthomonadales bacterium]
PFSSQTAGKDLAYTLYLLSAWFFYLAWCWRHGGMTLGMRAWKVRLLNCLDNDRNPPLRWWQCGLRFIGAWLSLLPLGMGYGWMLIDREQRSWHDRLSHTRLVHTAKGANPSVSDAALEEVNRSDAE